MGMHTFLHKRPCVLLFLAFLAFSLLAEGLAQADAVDDLLAAHLSWRAAHPVTKARLRVIGREGSPVGWYYLDQRPASRTEVSIVSVLLGKAELVMRTVKEANVARIFFNEDVYLALDATALSILEGGSGFWEAQNVAAVRAVLSSIFDIQGVVTKTVNGVTYTGIDMDLNLTRWNTFRGSIGANLVTNLPASTVTDVTLFFGPAGELHSMDMLAQIDVQILFYDWTDLTGSNLAQMDDARRPPHAAQQLWTVSMDEAMLRYIARLTQ
jgi:hypothetical protein